MALRRDLEHVAQVRRAAGTLVRVQIGHLVVVIAGVVVRKVHQLVLVVLAEVRRRHHEVLLVEVDPRHAHLAREAQVVRLDHAGPLREDGLLAVLCVAGEVNQHVEIECVEDGCLFVLRLVDDGEEAKRAVGVVDGFLQVEHVALLLVQRGVDDVLRLHAQLLVHHRHVRDVGGRRVDQNHLAALRVRERECGYAQVAEGGAHQMHHGMVVVHVARHQTHAQYVAVNAV